MMTSKLLGRRILLSAVGAALTLGLAPAPSHAQWVQTYEQFYLPAKHNWVFRQNYSGADRLFNAFDYGHAILYEELYTRPEGPVSRLEEQEYNFLTQRVLKRPPRVPLEEGAIEIAYVKLAPEAKIMFHWAHILHRQLYDVLGDERLSPAQKDAAVAEIVAYYKTRPDIAFSSVPKSMDIMDGHYYSLAFREKYPKFNGLIWAYHWLQIGLYEPLLVNDNVASRTKGVNATVGRFWQMLENAPETMPYLMPMTAGVAPAFAARYPEASIIFDNLHMMHDVISDILASPKVPREQKRAEILKAVNMFRDDTSYAISVDEWKSMGDMMGVHNMGGVATGFLAELPQPTVPRGMSMAGMDHSQMGGDQHGGHGQMQHGQPQAGGHAGMHHGQAPTEQRHSGAMNQSMMQMHMRMMQDSVIHRRVMQDSALHRMMMGHMQQMPAEERARMHQMMHGSEHGSPTASAEDRRQAVEFMVRLLSDPQVEARIHSDPELHRMWSDPEVQARLKELRQQQPAQAKPAPSPNHKH